MWECSFFLNLQGTHGFYVLGKKYVQSMYYESDVKPRGQVVQESILLRFQDVSQD